MSLYDGLIAPTADRTSDPYPRNLAVRQTDCEGATFLLKHFLGKRGELEDVLQLTNTLPVDRKEVNHILNGVGLLAPRPLAGLDLSDKYVVWCVPVKVPWCSHYSNVPKVTGSRALSSTLSPVLGECALVPRPHRDAHLFVCWSRVPGSSALEHLAHSRSLTFALFDTTLSTRFQLASTHLHSLTLTYTQSSTLSRMRFYPDALGLNLRELPNIRSLQLLVLDGNPVGPLPDNIATFKNLRVLSMRRTGVVRHVKT